MAIEAVVVLLFALFMFLVALICLWVLMIAYHTQIEVRRVSHEINTRIDQMTDELERRARANGGRQEREEKQ